MALRTCALFAGGAGLELGIELAVPGSRAVVYVEREAYAAAALVARMEEKALAPAPVWDDVATFDGRPWRGLVDCVAGGFPCQDISNAGLRVGIGGERSGLWSEFGRIIGEIRPRFAFVENVAALAVRGLDVVLCDLAALGFDAEWGVVGADDAGAPHQRDRLFILAHARREREQRLQSEPERWSGGASASGGGSEAMADAERVQLGQPQGGESNERGRLGDRSEDVADSAQLREREPDHAPRSESRERPRQDAGWRGWDVGDASRRPERQEREGDAPIRGWRLQQSAGPGAASESVGDADGRSRHWLYERHQSGYVAPIPRAAGPRCAPFPPGPDDQEGWRRYLQDWSGLEPAVRRGADGLAYRMERLRLLGNGVVPQQAALAFRALLDRGGWMKLASSASEPQAPPESMSPATPERKIP